VYKSLQAGRAIAAILVVLFHLGSTIAQTNYYGIKAFSIPFSFGNAGVPFFFVLSGFIIFNAHRKDIFKPKNLSTYIKKRLIRIYPTYWMIFLPVFLVAVLSPGLRNSVSRDPWTFLSSLLLMPQDFIVTGKTALPVAWTLQYEMIFYLFFALLIFSRWLSIIVGFTILYFYIAYKGMSSLSFPLSFLCQDYILLFAMGIAVSFVCTSSKKIVNRPFFM